MLTTNQIKQYESLGYLLLKGAIAEADMLRLERGFARNPPLDGTLAVDPTSSYPSPGRYTLSNQSLKDPDFAFIVEHRAIVEPVRQILDDDPKLTAFVLYDRTPGGPGLPPHHDYKRWRPVGSSMNWLFTIIPFCDFDEATGPLYIAPGSHHLERIQEGASDCLDVDPAIKPEASGFIDPGLQRGDLLLMNMHLWHKADGNSSKQHRVGLFNKYAAASMPPATGYFLFDDDVYDALSDEGKQLIGVHSNRPIATTRALLVRERDVELEVYLHEVDGKLSLPGGTTWDERAIPDWDLGNMIGPCQQHLREQANIEVPWLSYVGDYEETGGLCRVYGYTLNDHGFPAPYDGQWLTVDSVDHSRLANGWELDAVATWQDPSFTRGKGLSQAQCRIDQFAY